MRCVVRVEVSREGGLMAEHDRRYGFLDRRYHGPHSPRPGEEWEVEVVGENPRKTVFFWRPVGRVWPPADFPDALEVEGVVFSLNLKYGVYLSSLGSAPVKGDLENVRTRLAEVVRREREREALREKWGPVLRKAVQEGPSSPVPEVPDPACPELCREKYLIAERQWEDRGCFFEEKVFYRPAGDRLTAVRERHGYVSGRSLGRPAGAKGMDVYDSESIPLPEWFSPEEWANDLAAARAHWAWWWETEVDRILAFDRRRAWIRESVNNWLAWHRAEVQADGKVFAWFGEDFCEVVQPDEEVDCR